MDVTISIPDEVAERLERRAADVGQSVPAYAARVVADTVTRPTLDEILAPVRENFARSGMTEDQLIDLGRTALAEVRRAKQATPA
jgi:predicted transcriptional regulator